MKREQGGREVDREKECRAGNRRKERKRKKERIKEREKKEEGKGREKRWGTIGLVASSLAGGALVPGGLDPRKRRRRV